MHAFLSIWQIAGRLETAEALKQFAENLKIYCFERLGFS